MKKRKDFFDSRRQRCSDCGLPAPSAFPSHHQPRHPRDLVEKQYAPVFFVEALDPRRPIHLYSMMTMMTGKKDK
jgi:hypothetical protein